MTEAKEAVRRAIAYFSDLTSQLQESVTILRLEEVEKSDDGQYWLVTLSYSTSPFTITRALGMPDRDDLRFRSYKVFKVHAETGEVLSMKIRELHVA